ncbi:hypothetical protein C7M84_012297 [Penaeus vannamei]|uniref:Uncharacterized protein n=1 Tax=Penaeus vannamei TaxID=6689 RepID=A0A3R7Q616_PENVA|nr:hypothetical protein C7M84_012297 [Penaeus vannamei]
MPPPNMPRPSGPASLFDFFDVKMHEKKETVNFVEPVADVRGSAYQTGRGGRGGGREGRGGRGSRGRMLSRGGAVNGRSTPPDLASENWPAPGEEKNTPTSNRSYFESKELMEEKEQEDNLALRHHQLQTSALGRDSAPIAYRNDHGGQYGGYRDSGRRDYGGGGGGSYNSQDSRRTERGGRGGGGGRGTSGGYRGRGGVGGGSGGGGGYRDSNSNPRGGRGNSNSGYRGGTNSYREDGGNSNFYRSDGGGGGGSNYRQYNGANGGYRGGNSNYGNYGDSANYGGAFRSDSGSNYRDSGGVSHNDSSYSSGYKDMQGSRSSSNQYNPRYESYSNRQGGQNSYEPNLGGRNGMGGGRGGSYTSGRGGGGSGGGNMQASNSRTSKEMRLIQDFQRSMTLAGCYPQEMMNYGRYEDGAEYADFSGTLEFHRGGGSGRGSQRRGGRGAYY